MQPQMGSWLSDNLGINLDLSSTGTTLLTKGTEGAKEQLASQIVASKDVQKLAYEASQKTLADKISYWIVTNKKLVATGVIIAGALIAYKMISSKKGAAA